MKKTVFVSIATLSLLLAAPNAAIGMSDGQGQGTQMKHGSKMQMKKKMLKRKMNSPFLIKHGLPHLTRDVMRNWDNPVFALTAQQKEKLTAVRKETMGRVKKLKPEVIALKKEIVQASTSGTKASDLKEKVNKLASMEAEATMVHLNCIEKTKEILTKDQILFLLANKNKRHGMKGKMGHRKGMGMKQAENR